MTVSEQIIQVLDNLGEKFGLAIDWSPENILPYANELMNKAVSYELWIHITALTLIVIGMTLSWIIFLKTIKNEDFNWYDSKTGLIAFVSIIVAAVFSMIFIFCAIDCIPTIIACLTFPEKVIFDMVQSML